MKRICLCTLTSLIVFSALAQDSTSTSGKMVLVTPMTVKTRFGLIGGINETKLKLKDGGNTYATFGTTMRTSFHIGGFVNIPLGSMFRLQPALIFSGQGSNLAYTNPNGGATNNTDQSLHYINVPVMLQLQTKVGFFFETGPQLGFLISAKNKPETGNSTNNKDQFEPIDFGWDAGFGYLSRIGLGLNAQYNLGLHNVFKDATISPGTWKNQVIQIGLVYQFGAYK